MQQAKVKGHMVQKLEKKKQTDRRMDRVDYITCLANVVSNKSPVV